LAGTFCPEGKYENSLLAGENLPSNRKAQNARFPLSQVGRDILSRRKRSNEKKTKNQSIKIKARSITSGLFFWWIFVAKLKHPMKKLSVR
jgi:hypothetical protein